MGTKHTPGPWMRHTGFAVIIPAEHADRPLGGHVDAEIDRKTYAQEICKLHWPDRNRDEREVIANGYLIAAAPDLLEALHQIVRYADSSTDPAIVSVAIAAIAKAEGRTP